MNYILSIQKLDGKIVSKDYHKKQENLKNTFLKNCKTTIFLRYYCIKKIFQVKRYLA